ncbi:hypothetical protein FF38_09653 [Lucilia cuprina]|uniref:Histone acetyltransferase n=2 Tax=Lucilia cuprina TaxID=7375 RepID=A0A0L0BZE2_LUCCU|nr:hypothetical protein FF38_09653 [Lucilia cuprina]
MNSSRSTSTSSSGSSTSSGSTSCTDSGSSSTDSESTTSSDAKPLNASRGNDNNKNKPQVTTRRKSSESKANQQKTTAEAEKTKLNTSNSSTVAKQPNKNITYSSDDDTPPAKKPLKRLSTTSTTQPSQRRRSSGGFALTASKLQKAQTENTTSGIEVANDTKPAKTNENEKDKSTILPIAVDPDVITKTNTTTPIKKAKQEPQTKAVSKNTNSVNDNTEQTTTKAKQIPNKRSNGPSQSIRAAAAATSRKKCSDESEYDSVSGSEDDSSSSSSETESSDNSSYNSKAEKGGGEGIGGKRRPKNRHTEIGAKNKNEFSDSDRGESPPKNTRNRKLTRSLSTRRNSKPLVKTSAGASQQDGGSDSDSEAINGTVGDMKRSLCKSPAKKSYIGLGATTLSKCTVKKEISNNGFPSMSRAPTPPQLEKRCPVDGCDSSGHLSGNLDRHFLPEACPIYHNMSVSECKERANERKLRAESISSKPSTASNHMDSQKSGQQSSTKLLQTNEQKEFYSKIKESRARFKPIAEVVNSDKVKLEKDCNDEDREPSLIGLVPDYDLQLFRDAQALASEKIEDEVKDLPIGKGIKYITMGKYKMKVWYQSPYPEDVSRLPQMYICEFCLRYQKSETGIKRHAHKCVWRHPPGDEIYRKGKLQVWQVDGKRHKQYCQHLCLLAKFFLDHKTLYYDVEPFLFYIMTLADVDGCHTVGYFSKDQNRYLNHLCYTFLPLKSTNFKKVPDINLLILRVDTGAFKIFLVSLILCKIIKKTCFTRYLLTRVERKIGSPEKPLSDLGLISYRSYWKDVLLEYLCNRTGNTLSIKDVSQEMAIYSYDIVSTLQALGMMKYWKGKHIVLKKQDVLDDYEERIKRRGTFPKIDEACLRWNPFVPQQNNDSP